MAMYFYDGKNQADKKPYSFNKKVKFYSVQSVEDPNTGASTPELVYEFTLHYSPVKRAIEDRISEMGTDKEDTTIISVKHRDKIQKTFKVSLNKKDDIVYTITGLMPDDTNNPVTYDTLTLRLAEKRYRIARK